MTKISKEIREKIENAYVPVDVLLYQFEGDARIYALIQKMIAGEQESYELVAEAIGDTEAMRIEKIIDGDIYITSIECDSDGIELYWTDGGADLGHIETVYRDGLEYKDENGNRLAID